MHNHTNWNYFAMQYMQKGAAFFATKDVLKGFAKQYFGSEYRELTTIGAVFLANFPYCTLYKAYYTP